MRKSTASPGHHAGGSGLGLGLRRVGAWALDVPIQLRITSNNRAVPGKAKGDAGTCRAGGEGSRKGENTQNQKDFFHTSYILELLYEVTPFRGFHHVARCGDITCYLLEFQRTNDFIRDKNMSRITGVLRTPCRAPPGGKETVVYSAFSWNGQPRRSCPK